MKKNRHKINIYLKLINVFRTRVHLQNKIKETRSALYIQVYNTLKLIMYNLNEEVKIFNVL